MRTRRVRSARTRAGISLIEVVIGSVLLVSVTAGAFTLGNSATEAYGVASKEAQHVERLGGGISSVADVLRRGRISTVVLDSSAGVCTLDFEVADGYDAALGEPTWRSEQILFENEPGEAPANDFDDDGDGLVDEGRVVHVRDPGGANERRIVLVRGVARAGNGEIANNNLDDDGDGLVDEPGFNLVVLDGRVDLELTAEAELMNDQTISRTMTRTVGMRN